jgi:hypothetical protein
VFSNFGSGITLRASDKKEPETFIIALAQDKKAVLKSLAGNNLRNNHRIKKSSDGELRHPSPVFRLLGR